MQVDKSISHTNTMYFLLEQAIPEYLSLEWDVELPDYEVDEFGANYPPEDLLIKQYSVKCKTYQLDVDYVPTQELATNEFLSLCLKFCVYFVSRKLNIELYRNKTPTKKYHLFYPKDRVSLMDINKSSFEYAQFVSEDGLSMLESKDVIDKIDRFVAREDVTNHLFFCNEIKGIVCSSMFKKAFEDGQLSGVKFTPLDENYKYDPWCY